MTSRRLRIRGSIVARAGDGGVALAAPEVVLGAFEVARRPGVTDDERDVGRQRDRPPVERPAIEQDRRALDAARRGELVHQPALDPDVAVLRALAELGEPEPVDGRGGLVEEGPGGGQLDRRR